MPEFISVKTQRLRDVFSGDVRFQLPWFQRAYAWTMEEAGCLLSHVWDAANGKAADTSYLLGTIVVARQHDEPLFDLVDGQQRIMTLTVLFAVLRDYEDDPARRAEIGRFIGKKPYIFEAQDGCAAFLDRYVQANEATRREVDEDTDDLLFAEVRIQENRDHLRSRVEELCSDAESRWKLFCYLADNCYVVVHEFPDADIAWRWLQRDEETQHKFNDTDKAKNSLMQAMPEKDREVCGAIWDECEARIGSRDLYQLLQHLRLLKCRRGSGKPLESELAREFKLNRGGLALIDQKLKPSVQVLAALREGSIGAGTSARISTAIERACWLDEDVWVPAAMLWIEVRPQDSETELFFVRLERLVWIMRISGMDGHKRLSHILRLLAEIDAKSKVSAMKSLEPDAELRRNLRKALTSDTFGRRHFARPALRLISAVTGHEIVSYDDGDATLEHILPKGQRRRGDWDVDFPKKIAKAAADRFGNLTLLEDDLNNQVANYGWIEKRKVYAQSRYFLSTELKDLQHWNQATLAERTERLIGVLMSYWGLAS